MEECSRCKFAKTKQGPGKGIICRRFPGNIDKKPTEWCGEFERDPRLVRVHQPNAVDTGEIQIEIKKDYDYGL